MILDGLLSFTGTARGGSGGAASGAQTDAPTTGTQTSTNVLDIGIGLQTVGNPSGSGIPAPAQGAGARDLGIGDDPSLKLLVVVVVAFTGGTSLAVNIQGAPDNLSGALGAFTTMLSGPVVVEANLVIGARILDDDVPRPVPGQALPRYLQLQYVSVGTHGAGQIQGYIVVDRHDQVEQANAVLGGYPPGIAVAN